MKNMPITSNVPFVYQTIKNAKVKYGIFHKTCFHLHTPLSYDYTLFRTWDRNAFRNATSEVLLEICKDMQIIPTVINMDSLNFRNYASIFSNSKEMLAFLLIADALFKQEYELVVVADHNVTGGANKLREAIKIYKGYKETKTRLNVIAGIEISCADKNHVVGIYDDKSPDQEDEINRWLNEYLLDKESGVYVTSLVALNFLESIKCIGYIAHINTSDIMSRDYYSVAYKEKLFSSSVLKCIGLSRLESSDVVKARINQYRGNTSFAVVLDNDSHDIDSVAENAFYVKGSTCTINTICEAIVDYDIAISYEKESYSDQYIEGLYIEPSEEGFLSNDDTGGSFCLVFSSALNCLIGGRGTGKSTVLDLIDYILTQRCASENKLDFICKYGNCWLLYKMHDDEYLIELQLPHVQDADDSILRFFSRDNHYQYRHKYEFDAKKIREYTLINNLTIYRVSQGDDNKLHIERVKGKRDLLNRMFDTNYSVNELVNTANGDEIAGFIYTMILENKNLTDPAKQFGFRSVKGLLESLDKFDSILNERESQVRGILEPFNRMVDGRLRITYSLNDKIDEPNFRKLLGISDSMRSYYKGYNIKAQDVVDYLCEVINRVGVVKFIKMIVEKDSKSFGLVCDIHRFVMEDKTMETVEASLRSLTRENEQEFILQLLETMGDEKHVGTWRSYLLSWYRKLEHYDLEFNVNNHEGNVGASCLYKPVGKLSLGQKVVAMLSFILSYSKYANDFRPLIIDQPEDNLDTQYIYKNLVRELRLVKNTRQVVIATHNATIVTNAKADQVCVMVSNNMHGWIQYSGYPAEKKIKKQIINYMEGRQESFRHKMQIYKEALYDT